MRGSTNAAPQMREMKGPEKMSSESGLGVGSAPDFGARIPGRIILKGLGGNEAQEFTPGGCTRYPKKEAPIDERSQWR